MNQSEMKRIIKEQDRNGIGCLPVITVAAVSFVLFDLVIFALVWAVKSIIN